METLKIKIVADTSGLQRSIQNAKNQLSQLKTSTALDIKANVDIKSAKASISSLNNELQNSGQGMNLLNVGSNIAQIESMREATTQWEKQMIQTRKEIVSSGKISEESMAGLELKVRELAKKYPKLHKAVRHHAIETGKISPPIKKANDELSKMSSQSEKATKSASKLSKAFDMLKGAIVAIGAAGVLSYGKSAVDMVYKTNAMAGSLSNILGDSAKDYLDWARNGAQAFGISTSVATQYGMTFSSLVAGFSKDTESAAGITQALLKQSAVIASNTGRTLEDVVDRIRSGLLGNTEAIEDLAINVNVAAIETTEAFKRMADGRSWDQLDFNTQQAIRTQAILEQSMLRYGTALNPALAANLQMSASLQNFKLQLGGALIPLINSLMPALQKLVNALTTAMMYVRAFVEVLFGTGSSGSSGSGGTAQAMGKVEKSSGGIAKNLNDATSAAKGLNRQLAGFDELNVLTEDSGGVGGAFDGIGSIGVPDVDLSGFDAMSDSIEGMADKFEMIKAKVKEFVDGPWGKISGLILTVAAAFKVGSWAMGIFNSLFYGALGTKILGVITTFATTFTNAFAVIKGAITVFLGGVAAVPVGVVVAVGLVIGVIYSLRDKIREFVNKDWSKSFGDAGKIMNVWKDLVLDVVNGVETFVNGLMGFIKSVISGDWKGAWENAKNIFKGFLDIFLGMTMGLQQKVFEMVAKVFDIVSEGFTDVKDWLVGILGPQWAWAIDILAAPFEGMLEVAKSVFSGVSNVIKSTIETIKKIATGDWKGAWESFKDIFKSVFDTMASVIKAPVNGILKMINGMISGINQAIRALNSFSITVPDWIPVIGGNKFGFNLKTIGSIPYLANGGIPKQGQMFVANEAGPELVGNFGGRTGVVNNGQILQSMENAIVRAFSNANQGGTTIVMNGRVVGEELRKEDASFSRRSGGVAWGY
ncbi:MAG: hypothetical protein ACRCXB_17940 [Aeromonadaceae bacterium]